MSTRQNGSHGKPQTHPFWSTPQNGNNPAPLSNYHLAKGNNYFCEWMISAFQQTTADKSFNDSLPLKQKTNPKDNKAGNYTIYAFPPLAKQWTIPQPSKQTADKWPGKITPWKKLELSRSTTRKHQLLIKYDTHWTLLSTCNKEQSQTICRTHRQYTTSTTKRDKTIWFHAKTTLVKHSAHHPKKQTKTSNKHLPNTSNKKLTHQHHPKTSKPNTHPKQQQKLTNHYSNHNHNHNHNQTSHNLQANNKAIVFERYNNCEI